MEFIFSIPRLVIQTNFAPVISMLVLLAFIRTNINFPDHITRYFFYACAAALLLTLSDNMRFITAHMTEPSIYRYISAGCGYILRPLILYLVAIIISRKTAENRFVYVIPLFICAIFSIISIFPAGKGIMFSFNAENKFIRGPLGFLSHLVCFIYAFQIIFSSIKNLNNNKHEPIVVVIMGSSAVVAAFMENKYKFDFILSQVFISSIIYYYFFLVTQAYKKDPLTNFLNRRCFYLEINHLLKNHMILLSMDLNNLKIYNDTMGHAAGDRALVTSAKLMEKYFSNHGKIYRTGGDEFMVVFTKSSLEEVENFVKDFQEALQKTEYRVACGLAQYTPGDNIEKVITLSDERMYSHKVKLKNSESFRKI